MFSGTGPGLTPEHSWALRGRRAPWAARRTTTFVQALVINGELIQPIVTAVGSALWQLQMLEEALVAHLTLLHDVEHGVTRAELQAALATRRNLTFGQLLVGLDAALRRERTLDEALQHRLAMVKTERNWLVHHSQRDALVKANAAAGEREVMARLEALMDETRSVAAAVQSETERVLAARGHLRQSFERDVAAIAAAWAQGERLHGEVDD